MFRNPVTDLIVALVVVLLIFGPKRLPTLGRSLGQGLREFKDGITGHSSDVDEDRPVLDAAPPAEPVTSAQPAEPAAPPAPDRGSAEVGSSEQRA